MTDQRRRRAGAKQFVLTIIAGLSTALTAAPSESAVFDPVSFTLENGLRVVVISNHRAPIVSHMVWYKVGAADEPVGKSGIAHFLEHLMFKGTKTLAPGEFSKIVAQNGGQENAFTSQDYTGYYQNVAADRLPAVMKIEADRMANLVLTDEVVLPERDVILEERRSRIDNRPESVLGEQAEAALFQNHPYGLPTIGWEHEMRTLSTEDALDFYETYYAPNNAILIVAGDVTAEEVRQLAETHYGPIPSKPLPPRVRPVEPPHKAPVRLTLRDARVAQPSWSRQYLAPSYNTAGVEHTTPLQVLAEILGGGSTSRLYKSLVIDGQLAVAAGAGYSPFAYDRSTFWVHASPQPGVTIEKLEAALMAEVERVLDEGVTQDEVTRAVERLQAQAIFARDSLSTGARVIGQALTTGGTIELVESWPDRLGAVTPVQVAAAARAVFVEDSSVTATLLGKDRAEPSQ